MAKMKSSGWVPKVSLKKNLPKYLAVVDCIEQEIRAHKLVPGDQLPPNRQLAQMFDTTIATITKAMQEAARRGLIYAEIGHGTFIRELNTQENLSGLIDLSVNTVPAGIVGEILRAELAKFSGAQFSHHLFDYSSYNLSGDFYELSAKWISNMGAPVGENNLILTNGVHQGLLAAFELLLPYGSKLICEPLIYTGVRRIAHSRGVHLVPAQMDEFGIKPESIERLLAKGDVKVILITSSTHNPTTATLSLERRKKIAQMCRRYDAWVIEDGINLPLSGAQLPSISSFLPERCIFLTGLSKCVASGFRLGFAIVPEINRRQFEEALMGTRWIGPGVYARLAEEMLRNGTLKECIRMHQEEASARVGIATQYLQQVQELSYPSYHVWVKIPKTMESTNYLLQAQTLGVRASPESYFSVVANSESRHIRVSLGGVYSRDALKVGLERLASITSDQQTYPNVI